MNIDKTTGEDRLAREEREGRAEHWLREFVRCAFRPDARNILHWTSWALALGLEWALVIVLWDGPVFEWEQDVTRTFQELSIHDLLFQLTSTLTNTLSLGFIIGFAVVVIIVYLRHHRTTALLLLLTFPLHVLAQFPKALVDRPRPSPEFPGIEGLGGLQSFPSGHSEYVITFYGFIAYLFMRQTESRLAQCLIMTAWILFALATGFGRVAAGRHWPLDVFASYAIGLGLLSGMIWIYRAAASANKSV